MSSFRTTPASHWRANTYSVLSHDRTNFLNMMHLYLDFTFSRKPLQCAIVSVSQFKLSLFDPYQVTVKSLVLHLFPVPQTESHIIIMCIMSEAIPVMW